MPSGVITRWPSNAQLTPPPPPPQVSGNRRVDASPCRPDNKASMQRLEPVGMFVYKLLTVWVASFSVKHKSPKTGASLGHGRHGENMLNLPRSPLTTPPVNWTVEIKYNLQRQIYCPYVHVSGRIKVFYSASNKSDVCIWFYTVIVYVQHLSPDVQIESNIRSL